MIDRFLNAKHWQLFTLMFGIPFVAQMIMMGQIVSSITTAPSGDISPSITVGLNASLIISIIYMAFFYSWIWSIGVGLQSKIPDSIKMKVGRFKAFLIFPVIYMFIVVTVVFSFLTNLPDVINPFFIGFFMILHLFAMFCIFYSFYFTAKTIKTAEQQKEVSFGDFVGEFFLLWFYPIGVWVIQPKVNELHARDVDAGIEEHLVS